QHLAVDVRGVPLSRDIVVDEQVTGRLQGLGEGIHTVEYRKSIVVVSPVNVVDSPNLTIQPNPETGFIIGYRITMPGVHLQHLFGFGYADIVGVIVQAENFSFVVAALGDAVADIVQLIGGIRAIANFKPSFGAV